MGGDSPSHHVRVRHFLKRFAVAQCCFALLSGDLIPPPVHPFSTMPLILDPKQIPDPFPFSEAASRAVSRGEIPILTGVRYCSQTCCEWLVLFWLVAWRESPELRAPIPAAVLCYGPRGAAPPPDLTGAPTPPQPRPLSPKMGSDSRSRRAASRSCLVSLGATFVHWRRGLPHIQQEQGVRLR